MKQAGTVLVDFDSTVAMHQPNSGLSALGAPIPRMVKRVKKWLAQGRDVRIFTARVSDDPSGKQRAEIRAWCEQHLGRELPITDRKTRHVGEIWDDRARHVKANTGKVVKSMVIVKSVASANARPSRVGVTRLAHRVAIVSHSPRHAVAPYFHLDHAQAFVPIGRLVASHFEPRSAANAEGFMREAAAGKRAKRAPLTVKRMGDGRVRVLDGNATLAAARKMGLSHLPVVYAGALKKAAGGDFETKHPRVPAGKDEHGGEFARKDAGDATPLYPRAGAEVDGRVVRSSVPNESSIESSLAGDYTELPGIREVPMSAFTLDFAPMPTDDRVLRLAEAIKESGEINPLIVAVDAEGPYILEGGHRYDALKVLRAKSFPAVVVLEDGIEEPFAPLSKAVSIAAPSFAPVAPKAKPAAAWITRGEAALPDAGEVKQPTNDLDTSYKHAAVAKEHLDSIIDKGAGLGPKLGLHVLNERSPTDADYEEAHKRGGMVITAPLKSRASAERKIAQKGTGAENIRDLSRATVAVRHPADIPHVVKHLRGLGFNMGARPDLKKTDAGYQDVSMWHKHPTTGHLSELQIMPIDMHQAKEAGLGGEHATAGHKLYEHIRSMKPSDLATPEGKASYERAIGQSNALYGEAVHRMEGRTPAFALHKALFSGHRAHFVQPSAYHKGRSPLRPGLYRWDGHPARRKQQAGWPEYLAAGKWKAVPDLCKFDHEAVRINRLQFESLKMRHRR